MGEVTEMETAFAWLGEIMNWVGKWFPRLLIVRSTHAGVRFRHGKRPEALLPGLRVYWPLVTEVDVIPTARQTHNLPTQALTTSDGKKVVVSGVVVYRIKDIVATMARNWDVSDTLNDISMVAITKIITTHTLGVPSAAPDGRGSGKADARNPQETSDVRSQRLLDGLH